jgi:sugar phosphate isomerase/epimerase
VIRDHIALPQARAGPLSTERIGIERLCVFGLPPVQFVDLAADVGCRYLATGLTPMRYNPCNYPRWSLRDDPALRREMIAAMHQRGVSISLCEGFGVRPGADVQEYATDLDVLHELGGQRINVASMDPDFGRTVDQFAAIAAMAAARGIETTIEIGPGPVPDLRAALAAVRHVGTDNFRLLIDTMHFVRSGSGAADIAALDPRVIGYVQLCDVPLISRHATYMEEALYERMVPGTGELPLIDLLAALPRQIVLGLEVPQRSLVEAGIGPYERVARCVAATRDLLARIDAADETRAR